MVEIKTSGSSGPARLVGHSRGSLARSLRLLDVDSTSNRDGRVVSAFPLSSIGGVVSLLAGIAQGVPQTVDAPLSPRALASGLPSDVDVMCLPASLARLCLLEIHRHVPDNLQALRQISIGGSHTSDEELLRITDLSNAMVVDGYGLTETAGAAMIRLGPGPFSPLPGCEWRVVGADDAGSGEVELRVPGLADWIATGDMGRSEGGGLTLLGRKDGSLVRNGRVIYLTEVDDAARQLIPDEWGFASFVYEHRGAKIGGAIEGVGDPSEWESRRRSLLAGFGPHLRPNVVRPVASIPRLASGKPDRRALAALPSSLE